jgi:hypothetical protein
VLTSHDDNGNRLGRLLGGTDRCKVSADKHIDFELHEFGHKAWDTVQLALSVAILYENVLPLSITEISQPLPERFDIRPGNVGIFICCYVSYPSDFRRLLRLYEMD